jgi:hypothetical protein
VIGSNKDIEEAGPKPGRTPTNVPMRTPIKQQKTLIGSRETLKARVKWLKKSICKTPQIPRTPIGSSTCRTLNSAYVRPVIIAEKIKVIVHFIGSIDFETNTMKKNVVKR